MQVIRTLNHNLHIPIQILQKNFGIFLQNRKPFCIRSQISVNNICTVLFTKMLTDLNESNDSLLSDDESLLGCYTVSLGSYLPNTLKITKTICKRSSSILDSLTSEMKDVQFFEVWGKGCSRRRTIYLSTKLNAAGHLSLQKHRCFHLSCHKILCLSHSHTYISPEK